MKIHVLVPCLGLTTPENTLCLMRAREDLVRRGHDVHVDYHLDDAMISRARNAMTQGFLRANADVLVMIDSDIVFEPDAIAKLLAHDKLAIGANCRHKSSTKRWASQAESDDEPLTKARYLGTGFMLVRKEALAAVIAHKAANPTFDLDWYVDQDEPQVWGFFVPIVSSARTYLSEDYAFTLRLQQAGVDVWIDNTVRPGHIGRAIY